ncbi:MAG: hypothetical protein AB1941_06265 [Gemmatimonadota bacterium]
MGFPIPLPDPSEDLAARRKRATRDPALEALLRSAVGLEAPARRAQRSPSEVAAEFLQATAHLSAEETGALMGVSVPTVHRWRVFGMRMVRGHILSRMLAFLAEPGGATPDLPNPLSGRRP